LAVLVPLPPVVAAPLVSALPPPADVAEVEPLSPPLFELPVVPLPVVPLPVVSLSVVSLPVASLPVVSLPPAELALVVSLPPPLAELDPFCVVAPSLEFEPLFAESEFESDSDFDSSLLEHESCESAAITPLRHNP
jgi:hypothetical protein